MRNGEGLVVPALLLVAWQGLCAWGIFTPDVMPSPIAVVADLSRLWSKGQLLGDIAITTWRVALGFLVGTAVATVLGAVVGYSRRAGDYLDPTVQALKAVPSLAWVPLFILWFGIFEVSKVVLIAVGVFFPVYLNLVSGIRSTDRKLVEVGQVNGLGPDRSGAAHPRARRASELFHRPARRPGARLDVCDCSRADGRQQGLGLPDAGRADDWAASDDRGRPAPFRGGGQDLGRAARRRRPACPDLAGRFRLCSGQGGPMTLQISGLTKRYDDESGLGRAALDRIDLEVDEHEAVALVGTSGCGKTTLLRIISGIEQASAGRLTLRGDAVTGPRRDVGVVFQEPRLMPWLTARENIRLALLDLAPAVQDATIGDSSCWTWGSRDFATALPRQLSGGMAQRVAIARALARKPQVLLLDEPFSALDNFTRLKLQDHLVALWEKSRFTLILVTHDIDEAVALSDRSHRDAWSARAASPERSPSTFRAPESGRHSEFQAIKEEVSVALDLS